MTPETTDRGPRFTNEDDFRFEGREAGGSGIHEQIRILDVNNERPAVQALKEWALRQLAPRPGEAALDVGSGTGEDAVALGTRVAPGGYALGVEPVAGLRREAERRAAGTGAAVRFADGDIRDLPYAAESFDMVRCERVLQHISDPADAVRELVRVLRPGGRIVLIDTDWSTAVLHPGPPDVVRRVLDALSAPLANPQAGRQLRGLLAGAGVEDLGGHAGTWIDDGAAGARAPATAIPERAAKAGAVTREEADHLAGAFAAASREGAFFRATTLFAAYGALPTAARGTGAVHAGHSRV